MFTPPFVKKDNKHFKTMENERITYGLKMIGLMLEFLNNNTKVDQKHRSIFNDLSQKNNLLYLPNETKYILHHLRKGSPIPEILNYLYYIGRANIGRLIKSDLQNKTLLDLLQSCAIPFTFKQIGKFNYQGYIFLDSVTMEIRNQDIADFSIEYMKKAILEPFFSTPYDDPDRMVIVDLFEKFVKNEFYARGRDTKYYSKDNEYFRLVYDKVYDKDTNRQIEPTKELGCALHLFKRFNELSKNLYFDDYFIKYKMSNIFEIGYGTIHWFCDNEYVDYQITRQTYKKYI